MYIDVCRNRWNGRISEFSDIDRLLLDIFSRKEMINKNDGME
jgi:hypothetical protein